MPPMSSALWSNHRALFLPIRTPKVDSVKVMTAMTLDVNRMFPERTDKEIPMAKASMLVAMPEDKRDLRVRWGSISQTMASFFKAS